MARLFTSGAELNSTTTLVEPINEYNGTNSISSTTFRSGAYAFRFNPTTATGYNSYYYFNSTSNVDIYYRVYLYVHSAPTATCDILEVCDTGNVVKSMVKLTTANKLQVFKSNGTQLGSDTSALSLDTWYCIEYKHAASTSPSTLDLRIDGSSVVSGSNSSQGGHARMRFGLINANTTADIFMDDIAINDTTGSSQTSFPGAGKVICLKPNAAGDANSFAVQVGGTVGGANNYTRVNEVTPDDVTSYNGSLVLSQEDLFNCDNSGIGATDTVNVVAIGVRMTDLVGADGTAAFKLEAMKTTGGTKSQSGTIIPNSTTWITNANAVPYVSNLTLYNDPDSNPWTQSTLDSMQIGYILTATNVQTVAVSKVWAYVDYNPAAGGAATYRRMGLLGVGQ